MDMEEELRRKEEELLKKVKNKQVKVERNSILEPFDEDDFLQKRSLINLGASKITGSSRGLFGTSSNVRKG